MNKRYRLLSSIAFVVSMMVVLLLMGCGGSEEPTPTASESDGTPDEGDATPTAAPADPTPTADDSFDAAEYFSGATIDFVVGFNPGGGTDTHARFLGERFGEFIPGNPNIEVRNFTPNLAAQNFIWNSEPDGLTWGYNASPLIDSAEEPAAEYVASELSYIGAALRYDAVWLASGDLPYDGIDGAMGASGSPLIIADSVGSVSELTSQNTFPAMLLAQYLDLPFQFKVVASTGTSSALLDFERGDTNSIVRSSNLWFEMPLLRQGWTADGTMVPFVSLALDGSVPESNGEGEFTAPNVMELLTEEQRQEWDAIVGPMHFLSRTLHTSPGVPMEVLNVLRQAWTDAMADDEFRADFEELLGQPAVVTSGQDVQEQVRQREQDFKDNAGRFGELQQMLFDEYVN